jgi:hypothetical protein
MLDRSELEKIYETVSRYISSVERLKTHKELLQNLREFLEDSEATGIEDPSKILEGKRILAEDGGLLAGNVGLASYIFARAAALTQDDLLQESPAFILLPSRVFAGVSLEDLGSCVMKALEYRAVHRLLSNQGDISETILLFDGSLLADLFKLKFLSRERSLIRGLLARDPGLLLEHPSHIYEQLFLESQADPELVAVALGLGYLVSMLRVFDLVYEYRIYPLFFTKRPLSSRALLAASKAPKDPGLERLSDLELLNLIFGSEPFVTRMLEYRLELAPSFEEQRAISTWLLDMIQELLEALRRDADLELPGALEMLDQLFPRNSKLGKRFIGIWLLYYRAAPGSHVYKIEIPRNTAISEKSLQEIIRALLAMYRAYEGYPLELLLAHRAVHVPQRLQEYIESLVLSLDREHYLGGKDVTRV